MKGSMDILFSNLYFYTVVTWRKNKHSVLVSVTIVSCQNVSLRREFFKYFLSLKGHNYFFLN